MIIFTISYVYVNYKYNKYTLHSCTEVSGLDKTQRNVDSGYFSNSHGIIISRYLV